VSLAVTTDDDRAPSARRGRSVAAPSHLTCATPAVPTAVVERPHLRRRLDAAAMSALTLVVAPAGSGKSVALTDWAERSPRPVAWLDLDPADGEDGRFTRRVAEALSRLPAAPGCVLVLDRFDAVTDRALAGDVVRLLEHRGSRLSVVVASRTEPDLPLTRLRLRDEIVTVRPRDLAFEPDEAARILATRSGRRLTRTQVRELVARTEGWAAGLVLAGVALRDAEDVDRAIERFRGSDENVAAYLNEEVLARQPVEVEQFLLATSLLERFDGELCDAVTGRQDGHVMLDRLERESSFLVRLDHDGTWFRYHRLFRELLRHRARTAAVDRRALLARAADWHLARDDPASAATLLVDAEAWERVLDLVSSHARELDGRVPAATALRWIDAVPEAVREGRREVGFQRAAIEGRVGSTLAAEEELRRLAVARPFTTGEQLLVDVLRASWVEAHVQPDAALASADRALRVLASGLPDAVPEVLDLTSRESLAVVSRIHRGRALLYRGDAAQARGELEATVAESGMTYAPWLVELFGTLAMAAAWNCELRTAESWAARALRVGTDAGIGAHPTASHAQLALGQVRRERDDLEGAALVLSDAASTARRAGRAVPLAVATAELAMLDLALGNIDDGLRRIARHRRHGHLPLPRMVESRLRAAEVRLLVANREIRTAQALVPPDGELWTAALASAAIDCALATRAVARARAVLDAWPVGPTPFRSQLERGLWAAVVEDVDGNRRAARRAMAAVVAMAEPEGHVRLFLDAGRDALRVLRSLFESEPTPFLRRLVQPDRPVGGAARSRALLDPLRDRELAVLSYLPSRLSNAEIADQLYVSLNTLKTHLRHVYRKLGARSRGEAIVAAEKLNLI
jgi:LuxR family maltose regulon positive regulatory protein